MDFKNELYGKIKTAMPEMTVREFSRYCGKSEGYYGSITAQDLPLSTNALLHLAEVLTHAHANQPSPSLNSALVMIAEEVARRIQHIDTQNWSVREMVIKAVARAQVSNTRQNVAPMPIVLG